MNSAAQNWPSVKQTPIDVLSTVEPCLLLHTVRCLKRIDWTCWTVYSEYDSHCYRNTYMILWGFVGFIQPVEGALVLKVIAFSVQFVVKREAF